MRTFFSLLLAGATVLPCWGAGVDGYRVKSKYRTKARYFRRQEMYMTDLIRHHYVVQSWREIDPRNYSVLPPAPQRLSDRYFGDNLDRLIRDRRVGIR